MAQVLQIFLAILDIAYVGSKGIVSSQEISEMLKKKLTREQQHEAAVEYLLKKLSTDELLQSTKTSLARHQGGFAEQFSPQRWGRVVRAAKEKKGIPVTNNRKLKTKRRKRRIKGKQATAQPVTSDNSAMVPMAGRTIGTGSAADGLIFMQRALPGLIKLIQQTEETVAVLTGEEQ